MVLKSDYDIIISTCGKYSDLWDANIHLLEENWPDRTGSTFLVTDDTVDRKYDSVRIVAAGPGTEITERLSKALMYVQAEYVVFLLDDYFLTKPISNAAVCRAIRFMQEEAVDYVRLVPASAHYIRRDHAAESEKYRGFYHRSLESGEYKVNLTPGLWRTEFLKSTLKVRRNAWEYEVSLTRQAFDYGARIALSNHNEIPYLDVIRKGKVLRGANKYFKSNPVYSSDRKVMKAHEEWKIALRTALRHYLPRGMFLGLKSLATGIGMEFYSPVYSKKKKRSSGMNDPA